MDKLLNVIVEAIDKKKGNKIVSLDLSKFDGAICQYFVICDAQSTMQVSAIADGIAEDTQKILGEKPLRTHGQENSVWIAMDYGDIIVHIFQTEMRNYYKLEEFWGDAPMTSYGDDEE